MATKQSAAGENVYYPKSEAAFEALILVRVRGNALSDRLLSIAREYAKASAKERLLFRPEIEHYEPFEEYGDYEESWRIPVPAPAAMPHRPPNTARVRALRELARAGSLDVYELKIALEAAHTAVIAAEVELDSPSTEPLRRSTFEIQRVLVSLNSLFDPALLMGGRPVRGQEYIYVSDVVEPGYCKRINDALHRVDRWIAALRLLIRSPHTLPPPGYVKGARGRTAATAKQARRVRLEPPEREVLEALNELHATSEAMAKKAEVIASRAVGETNGRRVRDPIAHLKKLKFVQSKEGACGGTWITEKGLVWLHAERPELDPTRPNSTDSSATDQ